MCGQMRQFLDLTGGLWLKGSLVGKAGNVFISSSTQHGGQESIILRFHITLLHPEGTLIDSSSMGSGAMIPSAGSDFTAWISAANSAHGGIRRHPATDD
jgi:multimeric flavodoxin WrbA